MVNPILHIFRIRWYSLTVKKLCSSFIFLKISSNAGQEVKPETKRPNWAPAFMKIWLNISIEKPHMNVDVTWSSYFSFLCDSCSLLTAQCIVAILFPMVTRNRSTPYTVIKVWFVLLLFEIINGIPMSLHQSDNGAEHLSRLVIEITFCFTISSTNNKRALNFTLTWAYNQRETRSSLCLYPTFSFFIS